MLGGIAHDNVQLRLGGELEILQSEVTRLQSKLDGFKTMFVNTRVQWER